LSVSRRAGCWRLESWRGGAGQARQRCSTSTAHAKGARQAAAWLWGRRKSGRSVSNEPRRPGGDGMRDGRRGTERGGLSTRDRGRRWASTGFYETVQGWMSVLFSSLGWRLLPCGFGRVEFSRSEIEAKARQDKARAGSGRAAACQLSSLCACAAAVLAIEPYEPRDAGVGI
jgi:hypothetical protein